MLMKIFQNRLIQIALVTVILFYLLLILVPLPSLKSYSKEIHSKKGTLLKAYLSSDDKWRLETKLSEVTPELITAIIKKEDKWFYWHPGFNPIAIARALFQNIANSGIVSGASTITMQTARMLNPADRTYTSKFVEIFRALQLELKYSKNEILELYLSMLPYGGNIEGVKSASYIYFNKPPDMLSLAQAITLTVIPKDPNQLRIDRSTEQTLKRRNYWIGKFSENEIFKLENLSDAKDETLSANRYEIPKLAQHFCNFVNRNTSGNYIHSTLDLSIQSKTEKLLKNYVNRVKYKLVSNGAVLIIDNKTMQIVGYAGSADFNDSLNAGQVNGIEAVRSPGSTLKPGLYAKALDAGIITPKATLLDIPTDFSGYEPENYDLKFRGKVTAEDALQNSLNIPAVELLNEVGLGNYLTTLELANFNSIVKNKNSLGLSLILGGCGVTLFELTRFYTALANKGQIKKIHFEIDKDNDTGVTLFSAESAYIIATLLSKIERPDFPVEFLNDTNLPKFGWKTGTSFGKRDAWAVGFNKNYTIGVWMGNFSGEGSPHLSGAEMAVPLLFDLFNSTDYNNDKSWFEIPPALGIREVCSETGLLPSENCKQTVEDYFIENISSNKICDRMTSYYINQDSTIQYCPECLPTKGYQEALYPKYPPELIHYFNTNNLKFEQPPKHNSLCTVKSNSDAPVIISPTPNFEYFISESSGEEIALQASSQPNIKKHYWYINGKYYASINAGGKIFFKPRQGDAEILCLDNLGNSAKIKIKVSIY